MERGYRSVSRHPRTGRRSAPVQSETDSSTRVSALRLAFCVGIFIAAVFIKLLFPAFFGSVSQKLTTAIDYKTALTVLGEGLSGERKFTTAVGEAFTYAFKGASRTVPADSDDFEDAAETFSGITSDEPVISDTVPDAPDGTETTGDMTEEDSLSNAIISAFMQTQESYSDYNLPAGVTYEMPALGISYSAPVFGEVTSEFGYREHPTDGAVKFHYGIDIRADEGTPVAAFADGVVIAVGESTVMGNYLLINHDGAETKYAHLSEVFVSSGQAVTRGEEIAKAGATGNATAPCLHFELLIGGYWVNPEYYLLKV